MMFRSGKTWAAGLLLVWIAAHAAAFSQTAAKPETRITPADAHLQYIGRVDDRDPLKPCLSYPGTELRLRFHGAQLRLHVACNTETSALTIVVDHGAPRLELLHVGENSIAIAASDVAADHLVQVIKRTETWQGIVTVEGVDLAAEATLLAPPTRSVRRLMFIGDSVTCGTGINNAPDCKNPPQSPASDVYDSYGLLLGRRLDAETQLVCYGGRGLVRDYRGLSMKDNVLNAPQFLGLAVPADKPEERAPWESARWQPDGIVISLGTNDFNLQKTAPLDETAWVAAYVEFLKSVRALYPTAQIFTTEGAIVTDPTLRKWIQQATKEANDARIAYVPSEHYPGNGCDGHPTRAQHERMAEDFEPYLRGYLRW